MRAFFKFLFIAALLFGGIIAALRATCIEFWTVPTDDPHLSAAIVPTLTAGDTVVLWTRGAPAFASLVRCPHPESSARFAVGRILGEPGDRIRIEGSTVSLNDRAVHSVRGCAVHAWTAVDPDSGDSVDLVCDEEEIGGTTYTRARMASPTWRGSTTSVQVPDGQAFLVSDNRALPLDSRDFGPVPRSGCYAIALRLWSAQGWADSERRLTLIR